jgi:hypothetical protein
VFLEFCVCMHVVYEITHEPTLIHVFSNEFLNTLAKTGKPKVFPGLHRAIYKTSRNMTRRRIDLTKPLFGYCFPASSPLILQVDQIELLCLKKTPVQHLISNCPCTVTFNFQSHIFISRTILVV